MYKSKQRLAGKYVYYTTQKISYNITQQLFLEHKHNYPLMCPKDVDTINKSPSPIITPIMSIGAPYLGTPHHCDSVTLVGIEVDQNSVFTCH